MSEKIAKRLHDPLEDQGWQQMKVLLDREMPERKRRVIWWPWVGTAATIALLFLGYQYLMHQKESSMQSVNLNPDIPSILLEDAENKFTDEKVDLDSSPADLVKSSALKFETAPSSIVPSISESRRQKEDDIISAAALHSIQKNRNGEMTPEFVPETNEITSKISSDDVMPNQSEVLVDVDKELLVVNFYNLVPIATPGFLLTYNYAISTGQWFVPISAEEVVDVTKQPSIDFSLATGMLTDNSVSKPSFDLGGQIRIKPWGKISIGLGSFFWSINSDQTFSGVSTPTSALSNSKDLALSADQEMQRADSVSVPQAGMSYYSSAINNLTYWRVPVFIQFFPTGKWQPYFGINHNILLSDGSRGLLESNTSQDFPAFGAGGNATQPIVDLVRMSNTAFLLGLTFQTHKHISIDLAYAHSRQSYLNYVVNEGDFYEYHRFLRLSLAYRF